METLTETQCSDEPIIRSVMSEYSPRDPSLVRRDHLLNLLGEEGISVLEQSQVLALELTDR